MHVVSPDPIPTTLRTWKPGAKDSLFKYRGPRGGRVSVLRDDTPALTVDLAFTDSDILVCTPSAMRRAAEATEASQGGDGLATLLREARVLAVDEADVSLFGALRAADDVRAKPTTQENSDMRVPVLAFLQLPDTDFELHIEVVFPRLCKRLL